MKRKRPPLQFQDHAAASQCRRRAAELCRIAASTTEIGATRRLAQMLSRPSAPSATSMTAWTTSAPHAVQRRARAESTARRAQNPIELVAPPPR